MRKSWSNSTVKVKSVQRWAKDFVFLSIICVGGLSLILSVASPSLIGGVRAGVSDLVAPIIHTVSKPFNGIAAGVRDISGLADIQNTNARLVQENQKLREWYQAALRLEAENKSLKSLLNLKVDVPHSFITTQILMDPGKAFVKSVLVRGAQEEGVALNQAVISGAGLIGRVIEVGQSASRVLLLNDISSRIPVLIENTNQHAILAGQNDALPKLVHLPEDTKVDVGARIVTSGFGGVFPKGIAIGIIKLDDFGRPLVQPFEDLSRVTYVKIIQSQNSKPILSKINK